MVSLDIGSSDAEERWRIDPGRQPYPSIGAECAGLAACCARTIRCAAQHDPEKGRASPYTDGLQACSTAETSSEQQTISSIARFVVKTVEELARIGSATPEW